MTSYDPVPEQEERAISFSPVVSAFQFTLGRLVMRCFTSGHTSKDPEVDGSFLPCVSSFGVLLLKKNTFIVLL